MSVIFTEQTLEGWDVYHAEWMQRCEHVTLIDTVAPCWEHKHLEQIIAEGFVGRALHIKVPQCHHPAKRIDVFPAKRLIIIDPVPDEDDAGGETEEPVKFHQPEKVS